MDIQVASPTVKYTEEFIEAEYDYHTTKVIRDGNKLIVTPKCDPLNIRTKRQVPKLGVMLVGWGGNNGSTLSAAIAANKRQLSWETKRGIQQANWYGSITQSSTIRLGTDEMDGDVYVPLKSMLPMVDPDNLIVDGWDISDMNIADACKRAGVLEPLLLQQIQKELSELKPRPSIYNPDFIAANQKDRANNLINGTKQEQVKVLIDDIQDFKAKNNVDTVVVLWTANTERFCEIIPGVNDTESNLKEAINNDHPEISPSTLFAYAAITCKCIYINGSPQNTFVPGILDYAERLGVFIAGDDFKSGQTKFKSVLVDFLIGAGIKPVSIVSYNHLGNNDGKNLSAPQQFRSKEISKSNVVDDMVKSNSILYKSEEDKPDHCVVIKYVPYVGDSKRAMDEYTSEIMLGGLNTIVVHNTCEDSLLAVPIILDLIILAELCTRIHFKRSTDDEYTSFHSVLSILSYLCKAPLVPKGTQVVNALFKQKMCIENVLRACLGLPADNNMLLEQKITALMRNVNGCMNVREENEEGGGLPDRTLEPLQMLFQKMEFVEQFADSVVDYTSKYNNINSISYAPENLTGKPAKYPQYGDFPDTYTLRSYGRWWNESEAAQAHYMPQDVDSIISEDYIILRFEIPVVPSNVIIYETYNPGAVVRLWGRLTGGPWHLLFETPPEVHPLNARKFMPPIKQIQDVVNEIRLEFNQSLLNYHTSLDAVLLAGYKPKSDLQLYLLRKGLVNTPAPITEAPVKMQTNDEDCEDLDIFSKLPYEVIVHIFQYLDLKSLARCAQVSKRWYEATLDSAIYQALSLKKYWVKVDNNTLKYFKKRCYTLKKLDLSWSSYNCQITEDVFQDFLKKCGGQLTHLSLCNCDFVRNVAMGELSKCSDLVDLRLRNCFPSPWTFSFLANLNKLVALDLYSTGVTDESLIKILKANRHLKHLILDFCENLERMDDVTETVSMFNTQLVTFSCWKTRSLSAQGVRHLSRCHELRELDMGWCLILTDPEDCLEWIARGCTNLRRLILSNWRGLTDMSLLPVVKSCSQLIQLDLLGIKNITSDICDVAMLRLRSLKMLDVSFCEHITHGHILVFHLTYPHVIVYRN